VWQRGHLAGSMERIGQFGLMAAGCFSILLELEGILSRVHRQLEGSTTRGSRVWQVDATVYGGKWCLDLYFLALGLADDELMPSEWMLMP